MKNVLFCLLLITIGFFAYPSLAISQSFAPADLAAIPADAVAVFDTTDCSSCIYLEVKYGDTTFLNLHVLERFKGHEIEKVEMVFTNFSRTKHFDQAHLNQKRLEALQAVAPELFESSVKTWRAVVQTQCATHEESEQLFHGFVVHLPAQSVRKLADGSLSPAKKTKRKTMTKKSPEPTRCDSTVVEVTTKLRQKTKRHYTYTGKYLPRNDKKRKAGVRYAHKKAFGIWERRKERICNEEHTYRTDTIRTNRTVFLDCKTRAVIDYSFATYEEVENTVQVEMEENWEDWKDNKVVVIQDVTGSMSEYLDQTLLWHQEYAKKGCEYFVFFNDGDAKKDKDKILGRTGGVYTIKSTNFNTIQQRAQRAIKAGSGGDSPENNIEAVLAAQKKWKDADAFVMIADNSADVKDISLVGAVRHPIHIILCGTSGDHINTDYLHIAAITKGSIHAGNYDLDFANLEKGEVVEFGSKAYSRNGKRFQ